MPNNFREFIFKFFNNYLAVNTRLSHFAVEQSRDCTFCTLKNTRVDETFVHLFFYCPTVCELQIRFTNEFFDGRIQGLAAVKFWLCWLYGEEKFNFFIASCIAAFQFTVWEYKIRKRLPTFYAIKLDIFSILNKLAAGCPSFFYDIDTYDFSISRNFRALARRYGDG